MKSFHLDPRLGGDERAKDNNQFNIFTDLHIMC